jgi:LuxR family maltose regulon positive regulatory protein
MATPLLTTKLYAPPSRLNWMPRPQLIERLTQGLTCKLTVISAPAGFGKTTLVSEWRASPAGQVPLAWLSLDDDNDPVRFLTYRRTGDAAARGWHKCERE